MAPLSLVSLLLSHCTLLLLILFNLTAFWGVHQDELNDFLLTKSCEGDQIKGVGWTGHAIGMGGEKFTQCFVEKKHEQKETTWKT